MFIALDGPEGAGKTTQVLHLAERLRSLGVEVVTTREPGGTPLGEAIRGLLLDPTSRGICPRAEMLLFAAARAQFTEEVVRPALEAGRVVLSDRSVYASLAYQGYARGLGVEVVRHVNEVATGGLYPDLALILDVPPEVGLERVSRARGAGGLDRVEGEDAAFHQRVREGFLRLSREDPRVRVIPATGDLEEVAARIWREVEPVLRARGLPVGMAGEGGGDRG
ncbi:MAG: dTMP kinase [Armatimonadota bacterium]|nr:dTMP kinase [Armatimonadota bacterium]MDR7444457.1 dTMP kinase [Armatimonadota bacterium]MDR7570159.1 dTMP kinase [Armatimonadota bacterium]MDR7615238.1 dTMP kinase [Armatimonadota bacterium]